LIHRRWKCLRTKTALATRQPSHKISPESFASLRPYAQERGARLKSPSPASSLATEWRQNLQTFRQLDFLRGCRLEKKCRRPRMIPPQENPRIMSNENCDFVRLDKNLIRPHSWNCLALSIRSPALLPPDLSSTEPYPITDAWALSDNIRKKVTSELRFWRRVRPQAKPKRYKKNINIKKKTLTWTSTVCIEI